MGQLTTDSNKKMGCDRVTNNTGQVMGGSGGEKEERKASEAGWGQELVGAEVGEE